MNPIYQQFLDGTLKGSSTRDKYAYWVAVENGTGIKVDVYGLDGVGSHYFIMSLLPKQMKCIVSWDTSGYIAFKCALTGALLAVNNISKTIDKTILTPLSLTDPNDIGAIPTPTSNIIIPPSTPAVVVGIGSLTPSNNQVVRMQHWRRLHDSYTLAAGEKKTISYTVSSGIQQTSSDLESVSNSITGSASASAGWGWGSVSASISASLNKTSTQMQQVSLHTETTRYTSDELNNSSSKPQMFLKWELVDTCVIINPAEEKIIGTVETSLSPQIVKGPYDPSNLPQSTERALPDPSEIEKRMTVDPSSSDAGDQ